MAREAMPCCRPLALTGASPTCSTTTCVSVVARAATVTSTATEVFAAEETPDL
ncbi:MAG: hypothetical protein ACRDG8_08840 [Actinomycetota bacterium]